MLPGWDAEGHGRRDMSDDQDQGEQGRQGVPGSGGSAEPIDSPHAAEILPETERGTCSNRGECPAPPWPRAACAEPLPMPSPIPQPGRTRSEDGSKVTSRPDLFDPSPGGMQKRVIVFRGAQGRPHLMTHLAHTSPRFTTDGSEQAQSGSGNRILQAGVARGTQVTASWFQIGRG